MTTFLVLLAFFLYVLAGFALMFSLALDAETRTPAVKVKLASILIAAPLWPITAAMIVICYCTGFTVERFKL